MKWRKYDVKPHVQKLLFLVKNVCLVIYVYTYISTQKKDWKYLHK